jgi:hypothetical protein
MQKDRSAGNNGTALLRIPHRIAPWYVCVFMAQAVIRISFARPVGLADPAMHHDPRATLIGVVISRIGSDCL